MSAFHKSLRWRMQSWHGFLLLVVLSAFGVTAFWLVRDNSFKRLDVELQKRLFLLPPVMPFRQMPGNFRQPMPMDRSRSWGWGQSQSSGPEVRLTASQQAMFDGLGFYCLIWSADGKLLYGSSNAPANVSYSKISPAPVVLQTSQQTGSGDWQRLPVTTERRSPPTFRREPGMDFDNSAVTSLARTRDGFREFLTVDSSGNCKLVGHSLASEMADVHYLAWLFAGLGVGIVLVGWAVGYWLSAKAIQPIHEISLTARKISTGNLSERINLADTGSELAELAAVLNETFTRLELAFARQSQFAADASHELRTPTFVILSQAQSILRRERTVPEYQAGFMVCEHAARQIGEIIDSLLILARQDAGQPGLYAPCALDQIASEVMELLAGLAAKRQVAISAQIRPAQVMGDARQLRRLIINLLGNAIEHNKPGGEARLTLSIVAEEVKLAVADNGPGIAPAELPHIFERFYRGSKSRSGFEGHCGLGLAICDAIVKAHGGVIEVESAPGAGSVFTVRLPLGARMQSG